jgi:uncharacterized protein
MVIIKKEFIAKNMTCGSCEKIIEKQALKIKGVKTVKIDYSTGEGVVEFNDRLTDIDEILNSIEEKGYECSILERDVERSGERTSSTNKTIGWIIGVVGVIILMYFILGFVDKIAIPQISSTMGLGLLFLVGLLTGFHCVAMCGGFVVSYTAKDAQEGRSSYKSHLMYGAGKTLSYTIIGAIFGLIGSIIAFTPAIRGFAGIIAGLFLIIFGLNMLNVFPALRKFRIKTPNFLQKFLGKHNEKNSNSPLVIGLLNGLMIACGPLQAIYIMAAGTGSMLEGAKLLFVFALGTLPVMLGFGYLTSFLSSKATHNILKASGIIVMILGLIMLNNGLALTGSGYDMKSLVTKATFQSGSTNSNSNLNTNGNSDINTGAGTVTKEPIKNAAVQKDGYQEIRMDVTAAGWSPDNFVLKKGVPVHWIINGKEITSCNSAIQVPKYNLKFDIKKGEQTINFTPTESGVVSWSCWMGMIPGTFVVVDDLASPEATTVANSAAAQPKASGTCGMDGAAGGCGCGMMK